MSNLIVNLSWESFVQTKKFGILSYNENEFMPISVNMHVCIRIHTYLYV